MFGHNGYYIMTRDPQSEAHSFNPHETGGQSVEAGSQSRSHFGH